MPITINKQFIHALLLLCGLFILMLFIGKYKYGSNQSIHIEALSTYEVYPTWKTIGFFNLHAIPTVIDSATLNQESTPVIIKNPLLSHPPFAFYIGYLFYLVLGAKWYIINYILSFIAAIFIYATVSLLCTHPFRGPLHIPSLFAFLIYLSNPFVMKTQMHLFHPDTLVQTEFIALTYIALKMIMRNKAMSKKYLFSFSVLNFIMAYTSWIGILFSVAITLYGLVNLRKGYNFIHIVLLSLFTTLLALILMFCQYGSAIGIENYFHLLANTYLKETEIKYLFAFSLNGKIIDSIYKLLSYYYHAYWPIYLSIFIFILFAITGKRKKIVFTKNGYRYILLAIFPVMMSHLIFMSYSLTMPYSILYALSFLSVLMGILFEKIYKSALFEKNIFYILSSIPVIAQIFTIK